MDGIAKGTDEQRVRTGLRVRRRIDRALKIAASYEGTSKEELLERILTRELSGYLGQAADRPPSPS